MCNKSWIKSITLSGFIFITKMKLIEPWILNQKSAKITKVQYYTVLNLFYRYSGDHQYYTDNLRVCGIFLTFRGPWSKKRLRTTALKRTCIASA